MCAEDKTQRSVLPSRRRGYTASCALYLLYADTCIIQLASPCSAISTWTWNWRKKPLSTCQLLYPILRPLNSRRSSCRVLMHLTSPRSTRRGHSSSQPTAVRANTTLMTPRTGGPGFTARIHQRPSASAGSRRGASSRQGGNGVIERRSKAGGGGEGATRTDSGRPYIQLLCLSRHEPKLLLFCNHNPRAFHLQFHVAVDIPYL